MCWANHMFKLVLVFIGFAKESSYTVFVIKGNHLFLKKRQFAKNVFGLL